MNNQLLIEQTKPLSIPRNEDGGDFTSESEIRGKHGAGEKSRGRNEVEALRWIGEMYAVPADLLGLILGRAEKTAQDWRRRWVSEGLVESVRLVRGEGLWVWLTRSGVACSETGFRIWQPRLERLAHIRAACEVRLAWEGAESKASWVSERWLSRARQSRTDHVPDGIVQVGPEGRVAIEVERTFKGRDRTRRVAALLTRQYEDVRFYCTPEVHELVARSLRGTEAAVLSIPKGGHGAV